MPYYCHVHGVLFPRDAIMSITVYMVNNILMISIGCNIGNYHGLYPEVAECENNITHQTFKPP